MVDLDAGPPVVPSTPTTDFLPPDKKANRLRLNAEDVLDDPIDWYYRHIDSKHVNPLIASDESLAELDFWSDEHLRNIIRVLYHVARSERRKRLSEKERVTQWLESFWVE